MIRITTWVVVMVEGSSQFCFCIYVFELFFLQLLKVLLNCLIPSTVNHIFVDQLISVQLFPVRNQVEYELMFQISMLYLLVMENIFRVPMQS